MGKKVVSVILPVYNAELYLQESIESILSQTFGDFEFIIINDGSTDSSLDIIKKYEKKDSRIRIISRENKGIVYSLNEGIDLAEGKYIARMDADDISLSKRFYKQVKYLEDNSQTAVLGTFIQAFGSQTEEVKRINLCFNKVVNSSNILEKISSGCPICHPTVMMRKEFLNNERYLPIYNGMEDYELWMRAVRKGYIISNITQVLLKYRVHDNSKSHIERKEIILKQISYKLENFYAPSNPERRDVLVWGAGLGGQLFTTYIQSSKWSEKINILAVVDKMKEGYLDNIKIIKPIEIAKFKFSFIFITSELGYKEISTDLNQKGFTLYKDYISGI